MQHFSKGTTLNWRVTCCYCPGLNGNKQFNLVEPFDTNDGSLDGISAKLAFAMGVEWQLFRQRLKSEKPFKTYCLPQNAARLVKMAERHNRFVEDRPHVCAGWTEIFVGDCITARK